MTSVLSPCDRIPMHSDIKAKPSNFALVERYHDLLKSLNDGTDSNDVMMSSQDQEVPLSFCADPVKIEVDEEEPETVPDTPTILCDLSNYLPSESILHPAYDSPLCSKTTTVANSISSSSSSISTYNNINNIPSPLYRNCDISSSKPKSESSRNPPNYFSFKALTPISTPFSSYSQTTSSPKQQQQISSSSQSQFWSVTSAPSTSSFTAPSSSPSTLSSSVPSLHRQLLHQNTFSSSLSSLSSPSSLSSVSSLSSSSSPLSASSPMFINNSMSSASSPFSSPPSSISPSPLLSSTSSIQRSITGTKSRTFISELSGSGCTLLSGIPNFLTGNCYSESTSEDMMPPSRNTEESLEYTDLDKLPEISFYDDLTSMGSKDQIHQQPLKRPLSVDESGVPLEVVVNLMRADIENDRKELNLVHNPQCWSAIDVSRWVSWVCQKHGVPDISDQLRSYNGATLCSWPSDTFSSFYGASGSSVFQELDLWKTNNIYNTTANDDVTSGLQVHLIDSSQMFPSPSTSPAPSHGSNMSNHSNHSHDSHHIFNTSLDNSEDEVFYPETDFKMEMNSPSKTSMPNNKNSSNSNNNGISNLSLLKFKPRLGRGHKKAITLWQFLLELLIGEEDHSDCIKWLNKESRIFKIEDSKKVASMWGRVKSRPAMNYDKLSRSVRQYYKKGIIKKPEQTKRLVYQFCPGIC